MIKVNLLKGKVKGGGDAQPIGNLSPSMDGELAVQQQNASFNGNFSDFFDEGAVEGLGFEHSPLGQLSKIIILFGFAGLLFGYDYYMKVKNQSVIAELENEIITLRDLQQSKTQEAQKLSDVKQLREELKNASEDVAQIKINRLEALRGLDAIQSSIPSEVWLTNLKFEDGVFELRGRSIKEKGLDDFVSNLQMVKGFSEVNVPRDLPGSIVRGKKVNEFTITLNTKASFASREGF